MDIDKLSIEYAKNSIKYFTVAKNSIFQLLNENAKIVDKILKLNDVTDNIKNTVSDNSIYLFEIIQKFEEIINDGKETIKECEKGEN